MDSQKETDSELDRQTDRETERRASSQTDRQTFPRLKVISKENTRNYASGLKKEIHTYFLINVLKK